MTTPGIITNANLPNPVPLGLIETLEAAMRSVFWSPDDNGDMQLNVSDITTAQSIVSDYAGSSAQVSYTQAQMLAQVDAAYAAAINAGCQVTVQGTAKIYQIDPASQGNVTGAGAMALACIATNSTWPSGYYWIAADNTQQAMNATDVVSFAQTIGTYVTALIITRRSLKDSINAASDMTTLTAINLSSWPENDG
jgi:hypothetical protein